MQQNYAIAVIIIVLFVVITGLSYGIYRLIQAGRASNSTTTTSESLADDDDPSGAWLELPRFVAPNIPPDVPPQRVVQLRPRVSPPPQIVQIEPSQRDPSVSPMEADPLALRPVQNPPSPVVIPAVRQPLPVARRRTPSRHNPPAPPAPSYVILPASSAVAAEIPPPPPIIVAQPSVSRPLSIPRSNQARPRAPPSNLNHSPPAAQAATTAVSARQPRSKQKTKNPPQSSTQGSGPRSKSRPQVHQAAAPHAASLQAPPREDSVSSMDVDPLAPRPLPGSPPATAVAVQSSASAQPSASAAITPSASRRRSQPRSKTTQSSTSRQLSHPRSNTTALSRHSHRNPSPAQSMPNADPGEAFHAAPAASEVAEEVAGGLPAVAEQEVPASPAVIVNVQPHPGQLQHQHRQRHRHYPIPANVFELPANEAPRRAPPSRSGTLPRHRAQRIRSSTLLNVFGVRPVAVPGLRLFHGGTAPPPRGGPPRGRPVAIHEEGQAEGNGEARGSVVERTLRFLGGETRQVRRSVADTGLLLPIYNAARRVPDARNGDWEGGVPWNGE